MQGINGYVLGAFSVSANGVSTGATSDGSWSPSSCQPEHHRITFCKASAVKDEKELFTLSNPGKKAFLFLTMMIRSRTVQLLIKNLKIAALCRREDLMRASG